MTKIHYLLLWGSKQKYDTKHDRVDIWQFIQQSNFFAELIETDEVYQPEYLHSFSMKNLNITSIWRILGNWFFVLIKIFQCFDNKFLNFPLKTLFRQICWERQFKTIFKNNSKSWKKLKTFEFDVSKCKSFTLILYVVSSIIKFLVEMVKDSKEVDQIMKK